MPEENPQEEVQIIKPCGPEFTRKRIPRDRTEAEYFERLRLEREEAEQLQEEIP